MTEKAQDPLKVAKNVYKFIMENDTCACAQRSV